MELALLAPTLILGGLLWLAERRHAESEKAWRLERVGLLNRIQAPEVAAYETDAEPAEVPPFIPAEDDAAWEQYAVQRAEGEAV